MNTNLKPGDEVYCKKRTKYHKAKVIQVYEKPPAVRIRYRDTMEEWTLRPEEVKFLAEKEAEEKAECDAQKHA